MARCRCPCHSSWSWQIAAESLDVIEAATACNTCRNAHCDVLLTRPLWHEPPPERSPWTDPPPPAEFCSGEGSE